MGDFVNTANFVHIFSRLDFVNKPKLEQNRLCYYCYDFFFHYLNEYLRSFLEAENEWQREEIAKGLAGYLAGCWIYERLDAADAMG